MSVVRKYDDPYVIFLLFFHLCAFGIIAAKQLPMHWDTEEHLLVDIAVLAQIFMLCVGMSPFQVMETFVISNPD